MINVSLASLQLENTRSTTSNSAPNSRSSPMGMSQSSSRRDWDFTRSDSHLNVSDWKSPVGITVNQGREEIFHASSESHTPNNSAQTYGGEWVDQAWTAPAPKKKFTDPFVRYHTPHDIRSVKLQNPSGDKPYFVEVETDYDAFRDHPIIPTKKELLNPPENLMKTNTMPLKNSSHQAGYGQIAGVPIMKVFGEYNTVDEYLHTQYELMRYDSLIPLQMAIASYKAICDPPDGSDPVEAAIFEQRKEGLQRNYRLYESIKLDSLVFSFHTVAYRISFRLPYGVSVNWEASKRLTPGTLVILSRDGFVDDIKIASVAHREVKPMRGRNRFEYLLDLHLEADANEDPLGFGSVNSQDAPLVMLEATSGYFEAYRHIMAVLQEITPSALPFASQIVKVDPKIGIPKYAQTKRFYDLSLAPRQANTPPRFPADVTKLFPPYPEMGLDETQYRALQRILSRKLSIVQGPPGTGKTHVGLYATHILLKNFANDNSLGPIICICQTNHAVDQFLEHILKYEKKVVRVGGRSKSEALVNHTLYELRKTERERGTAKLFRKRNELQKKMNDLLYELYEEPCVSIEFLKKAGILPPKLLDSFKRLVNDGGQQQTHSSPVPDNSMDDEWVINSEPPSNLTANARAADGNKEKVPEIPPNPVEIWLTAALDVMNPLETAPAYDISDTFKDDLLEQQKGKLFGDENDEEDAADEEEVRENIQNFRDENDSGNTKDKYIGLGASYWHNPATPPRGKRRTTSANGGKVTECKFVNYYKCDDNVGMKRRTAWQISNDWAVWRQNSDDISTWPLSIRLQAHHQWQELRNKDIAFTIKSIMKQYLSVSRDFKLARTELDAKICKQNRIIGMTSTAAAKYHNLLETIKPRVIILEEAAEMLESHIVTAIPRSAQHVILIGDQQQLRPNPSVYALGEYHNFNVSLFERLIANDIPFSRLSHQRRMAPQIRSLVDPIYRNPPLMDHPHVLNYPNIPGMQQNMFFLIHNEPESHVSESASKYNDHEAQMAAHLASYLIMQGIPPDMITILTMYSGQRRKLLECLRKERRMGDDINLVRVCSVDGFQGEESEVVILSLVRSNTNGAIGFLKIANRVCVALSRAKKGMYILGNGAMLCRRSELWNEIIGNLEDQHPDCIGEHLMLRCQAHPDRLTAVQYPIDFKDVEEGGCGQPCETILPCGHQCPAKCHVYPHEGNIICRQRCLLTHQECGHPCQRQCREKCGKCLYSVRTQLKCGHEIEIACGDTSIAKCNRCSSPW